MLPFLGSETRLYFQINLQDFNPKSFISPLNPLYLVLIWIVSVQQVDWVTVMLDLVKNYGICCCQNLIYSSYLGVSWNHPRLKTMHFLTHGLTDHEIFQILSNTIVLSIEFFLSLNGSCNRIQSYLFQLPVLVTYC